MVSLSSVLCPMLRPGADSSCCRCTLWPLLPNLHMLGNLHGWEQLYGVATSNLVGGADHVQCTAETCSRVGALHGLARVVSPAGPACHHRA
jgi:hypothetical protein